MPASWKETLLPVLNQLKRHDASGLPRACLIGIGSDLRGDNSVGVIVVRRLLADQRLSNAPNLLILEGGSAPENLTGKLRAFHPHLVLFIDAAHLEKPPGTIQLIPLDDIDGMSASSHSLPLSMLAHYITSEFGSQVQVLGIQPAQNEFDLDVSASVSATVENIVHLFSDFLHQS